MLHEIAERCMIDGGMPHRFIGEHFNIDGFDLVVDKSMTDALVPYLFRAREIYAGGVMKTEERYALDRFLGPGQSGTADLGGTDFKGHIHVIDWKMGEGVAVSAEANEQLMLYALGFLEKYHTGLHVRKPKTKVTLHVMQPFIPGASNDWDTTVGDLYTWAEVVVRPKIEEIKSGNTSFNAGPKQCKFCLARIGNPVQGREPCRAYQQYNIDTVRLGFPDLSSAMDFDEAPTAISPSSLTPEQRVWLYDRRAAFVEFLDDIAVRLRNDLMAGRTDQTPGKKLIHGRQGNRQYVASALHKLRDIAERQLGDAAYKKELISPAQIEKALGQTTYELLIEPYIYTAPPSLVIADVSSPKPAVNPSTEGFVDETQTESKTDD